MPSEVAYVDVLGSPTSECTTSAPCSTVERALAVLPPCTYIVIQTGTYLRTGPLMIVDTRWLIGRGTPQPVLDRTDNGPIVLAQGAVNLHIDQLELSGATGDATMGPLLTGYGLYCRPSGGAPVISVRNSTFRANGRGLASLNCNVSVFNSAFSGMDLGLELRDSTATIDRNTFLAASVTLDSGVFTFQNNLVARSPGTGVSFYSTGSGSVIAFNTIVDNGLAITPAYGIDCQVTTPASFPNNIIARNRAPSDGANCTYPSSIVVDSDITGLKFKHPDSAPYDYHLLPGSIAIDAATISTLDHDIDGDARPKGAGRDVGADEAQ